MLLASRTIQPAWEITSVIANPSFNSSIIFYRLLKNNGSIAIECPDLSKIISGIQASDHSSLLPGAENLISLIFGDVTSEDYLLPNKWGYSIHTLGMLLNQAGFSDFTEEMPLHSVNNEHFFRISAKKL